jgi:2-aminoadipate transaminase
MNWEELFARRTKQMRRSAIRELLKVTARPDFISFAGGLPDASLFPVERARAALDSLIDRRGGNCFQYGATEGLTALRDWIAEDMTFRTGGRVRVQRENVMITSGGQQGLDLVGRIFLEEGDRVVVEDPTYLALLSAWRPQGVEFSGVECDADGLCVDQLESLLKQKPKMIYTVPDFQNPQGTTLSLSRRRELVRLIREQHIPILEDNPYGDLRYSGQQLPTLLELDAADSDSGKLSSFVIHAGTFSKTLMPGLRIGWIVAAEEVIEKLVQAKQSADLHTSTLCQHLALELVTHGCLEETIPLLRQAYGERRKVMLAALSRYFPTGTSWTAPAGGMFLMVKLPGEVDASDLLTLALEEKVAFLPGEEFHLNGKGRNTLRLNFSNSTPEKIEAGIARLGSILSKHSSRKLLLNTV